MIWWICTDTPECSEHVDLDVYAENLVTLFKRWAPHGKTLMWVTTTPVPNVVTSLGRTYANAIAYNAAALAVLQGAFGSSLPVIDLWGAVIGSCGALYTSCPLQLPANVHFTPAGQQFLGEAMAAAILTALGA